MSTTATYNSIDALRTHIVTGVRDDWAKKMLHQVPDLPTVKDRAAYLVEKAKDKVVLDIGCTGVISPKIKEVAKAYYGLDKVQVEGGEVVDLDHRPDKMPIHEDVDTIIASEVLEHLANPGIFLMFLKKFYPGRTLYLTTPNAGAFAMKGDCEVVNNDHVCWYSYQTLKTLLERYKYEITQARWYNAPEKNPYKAEGLIMVVQT